MKEKYWGFIKYLRFSIVLGGCCMALALPGFAQVDDSLSGAALYRLIAQLELEGQYTKAADAYRILAERDLAEIENLDRAIKNYIEAQKLYRKAGDSLQMFQTITDLGRLYGGSEYYMEAISMFERVEGYARRTRDTLMEARMLQQIGEIHIARNHLQEASKYFGLASRLNLLIQDTLLSNINKLTITALTGKRQLFQSQPDSLTLDLTRYDSIRYQSFLPSIHLHVGMYNMHAGKYKLALYNFTQGLRIAGNDSFIKRELYRKQAECLEMMDDFPEALEVMKRYTLFNDSLNDASKSTSIQQMLLKYRDIERESELTEMARDRNITFLKSRLQKILTYAILFGAIIMLIGSYIVIRGFQERLNANQIITKQNEEINQRMINEMENNRKIETISSMLQGQEVERERIARDLHDSLGGLLSTVKLHFDAIQVKQPEITSQQEYNKAYNLLDAACNEVRTISNNMQPGALLRMGIIPAIKDLINRIESEETPHIEFIHYGDLQHLPIAVSLHIYRMVQELLFNCIKHAQAKEILIQLILNEEDIEVMIEDDGIGYDPVTVRKGMGTENVAARVNFLKGEISVHSESSIGTNTTITIPYTPEEDQKEVFSNIDPTWFDPER